VSDPYRALENADDEKTMKFVEELNKLSRPYFDAAGKVREKFVEKLDFKILLKMQKFI
jgi:prolyl oligopeptidase PreP (S9A serine peptidase family)